MAKSKNLQDKFIREIDEIIEERRELLEDIGRL